MFNVNAKFFKTLPILAFLGYCLFSCLICALVAGDVRLLKIWFVASPVLAASVLGLVKILLGRDTVN